jgi:hypothetical protein
MRQRMANWTVALISVVVLVGVVVVALIQSGAA